MTELVGQYEGETAELYGVWLVHKSLELEKVVADITNVVNAYGVNEGIKQGYHAAKTSEVFVTDVLGFDEDAKIALDAAIESINSTFRVFPRWLLW
ncbi:hypothetical protein Hanom_Chr04g00312581 [Helianthus anomalus]